MLDKLKLTQSDRELFLKAWEQFCKTGVSETKCNYCGEIIEFSRASTSAVIHRCKCGKFTGEMKGL